MKFLILFMFVAVALADQESEDSLNDVPKILAKAFEIEQTDGLECVNKSGTTYDDMKKLTWAINISDGGDITCEVKDKPSLKKPACAVVCCAQKKGLMIGREVQVEEMSKYIKGIFLANVEVQVRNAVGTCKEEVTEISDECMVGFEFVKCMYKAIGHLREDPKKN
ncbi:pheromone-binding protein Gp-9-like [Lasioglossum baleicum]|uniref:pheromone-binding protein Gp-9-like n=1 Tax=Lasioglossum baleicum TaxID=434251 RepID=UPI003FCD210A